MGPFVCTQLVTGCDRVEVRLKPDTTNGSRRPILSCGPLHNVFELVEFAGRECLRAGQIDGQSLQTVADP